MKHPSSHRPPAPPRCEDGEFRRIIHKDCGLHECSAAQLQRKGNGMGKGKGSNRDVCLSLPKPSTELPRVSSPSVLPYTERRKERKRKRSHGCYRTSKGRSTPPPMFQGVPSPGPSINEPTCPTDNSCLQTIAVPVSPQLGASSAHDSQPQPRS